MADDPEARGEIGTLLDEQWDQAERIVDDLYESGILCGHPDRNDAHAVVMGLFRAGFSLRCQACQGTGNAADKDYGRSCEPCGGTGHFGSKTT